MSLGGLRKQFHKTSQYLGEKVVGNKGSEIDKEIIKLGAKFDVVYECVEEIRDKTKEYLQPNPAARTKVAVQSSYQKARGQTNTAKYIQPEFNLSEIFNKYGEGLDSSSDPHAASLVELGATFNDLSDVKDEMEIRVMQTFLDPLTEIQVKELKEINTHRKKLKGRRLDYDYKRNKGEKVTAEELQTAKDKFVESQKLCYDSMTTFLGDGVRHVKLLRLFTNSMLDYHKQCASILEATASKLDQKVYEAQNPDMDDFDSGMSKYESNDTLVTSISVSTSESPVTPSCKALYDFSGENDGDLSFKAGELISLLSRLDECWLTGSIDDRYGVFPESYVTILVPLLTN